MFDNDYISGCHVPTRPYGSFKQSVHSALRLVSPIIISITGSVIIYVMIRDPMCVVLSLELTCC